MIDVLKRDLYRYEGPRSSKFLLQLRYIFFTPGFQFTYVWRRASLARNPISRIFWKVLHRRCMFHTGIQIPIGTQIGPGLKIGHFGNIVINPDARIGSNFSIAQGALIGNAQGKKSGVPTIGNNVVMGANSIVVGGVDIGDYVLIAPGAFINFNVPDHSIVIGNPAIVKSAKFPTNKYNVYTI